MKEQGGKAGGAGAKGAGKDKKGPKAAPASPNLKKEVCTFFARGKCRFEAQDCHILGKVGKEPQKIQMEMLDPAT